MPQGIVHVAKRLPEIIEIAENDLPIMFRDLLVRLRSYLLELNQRIQQLDDKINSWHKSTVPSWAEVVYLIKSPDLWLQPTDLQLIKHAFD